MSQAIDAEFGRIRSFFWPIYKHEAKKLIPMLLMGFLICFNYSILRCLKDTVVVTASSASVIPFIKVWALLPIAIILTLVFTKLTSRFSQERVFYIMTSGFVIYFALFGLVFYPNHEKLRLDSLARWAELILPQGFSGLIAMIENWSFTLFYVISELWSSMVFFVLFWGFANEVTKITEARRFYAVISVFTNVAAILAGQSANYLDASSSNWEQTVSILLSVVVLGGVAIMLIFAWINKNVLNDPSYDELHYVANKKKANKRKLSITESFSHLSNSKYLLCIAVLVVAYNLVINLVEVIWKDQLQHLYPEPGDFNRFMNNITSMVGIFSTITSFFMARMIGKFGWTKIALITPLILLVTSLGFFIFLFFQDTLHPLTVTTLGLTPLALSVYFGGMQNVLSKAAKYSVFDATKEMSFIPLDHESKLKGKAAIDGVGSRFGKSGGSIIHEGLLLVFGSLSFITPYVAAILMIVIAFWIGATKSLGRQFNALAESKTQEAADAESSGMAEQKPAVVQG